jgi:hypothetical protein
MSMNFIEQIFGVAPDRGDGSLELMLLGIIVVLLVSALALFQVRKPNVTSGMVLGDPEGPIQSAVMRISTARSASV